LCALWLADGGGACSDIDAVFLLDSSLSVRELCPLDDVDRSSSSPDNWTLMLRFVSEVVDAMPLKTGSARVAVATYSTSVSDDDVIGLGHVTDAATLRRRISELPFLGGNTNMTGALRLARSQLRAARSTSRGEAAAVTRKQYVILLTDGANNVDTDPVQEARLLKHDDVRLITVGISDYVDDAQLKEMASAPADYSYIYAADFSHLNRLVGQLLDRLLCSNPPPAQRKICSHSVLRTVCRHLL